MKETDWFVYFSCLRHQGVMKMFCYLSLDN